MRVRLLFYPLAFISRALGSFFIALMRRVFTDDFMPGDIGSLNFSRVDQPAMLRRSLKIFPKILDSI